MAGISIGDAVLDENAAAFIIFMACYGAVYAIGRIYRSRLKGGKAVRESYRASFIETLLTEKGNFMPLQQLLQNNIAITGATLTGVMVMAGILFDQIITIHSGLELLRSAAMLILLGHILLSLLAQIRTMMYIPVIFGTDQKVIRDTQNMSKHEYLTKVFSSSYSMFSNAMRDVFFLFVLFIWLVNAYVFIGAVLLVTFLVVREETEKSGRITVF